MISIKCGSHHCPGTRNVLFRLPPVSQKRERLSALLPLVDTLEVQLSSARCEPMTSVMLVQDCIIIVHRLFHVEHLNVPGNQ